MLNKCAGLTKIFLGKKSSPILPSIIAAAEPCRVLNKKSYNAQKFRKNTQDVSTFSNKQILSLFIIVIVDKTNKRGNISSGISHEAKKENG